MQSTWPGSTLASSKAAKLAFNARHIRRSKYIAKRRLNNPIQRRYFGKSITAKLSYITSGDISGVTDWVSVYGLNATLSASNDWPFYRDTYAMFNILHVTVKVYPQAFATSAGINRIACICYDLKNNVALGSQQSAVDHLQHLVMNFSSNGSPCYVFTTKCKPIGTVPISTSSNAENWGYIKAFADNGDFGAANISICRIQFIFTVAFSSEQ